MYLLYDLVYATLCPFIFTIILLGKREQVALLSFSSYSLMIAVWHFIVVHAYLQLDPPWLKRRFSLPLTVCEHEPFSLFYHGVLI